jgi:hypothetical protein
MQIFYKTRQIPALFFLVVIYMLVGEVFARMGLDSKQYEKSLDRLENVTKKRALTLCDRQHKSDPLAV